MATIATRRTFESLQTSQDYFDFYAEGGLLATTPWEGINDSNCDPKSRVQPCEAFRLAGTHTIMTDKEGVSSLTVDAVLTWKKAVIDPPVKG